jgi:c-di-GMP-binding flagellar brake protein YcgR
MENRRQFERIFFSAEDRITGSFALADSSAQSDATVMDLSVGGIRLTIGKDDFFHLKEGERLRLIQLEGAFGLEHISHIEMEVRWVLSHPSLNRIGVGCHFLDPTPEVREHLLAFMESWIKNVQT